MRRTPALVVLAVLGVVVALGAWFVQSATEPAPWDKPVTVDGDVVTTTYSGSDCRSYARVEVDEDAEQVVVTVHETVLARSCNDMAVPYDVRFELDEPLGERELVDGACLMDEYDGRPACAQ